MNTPNRRAVLTAAGLGAASMAALAATKPTGSPRMPAVKVGPGDSRFPDLLARGANTRFRSEPDYVHLASTTEQVVAAVAEAVDTGKRIAVRSGGHCFESFVDNPDTQVIIDLAGMTNVWFDADRRAFAIEPGALLGDVYRRLFLGWGVTIPTGSCVEVAAGGHILGGGHGPMSRLHGLGVDHLHAVEVVTVDARGRVRATVATRGGPNHDLWWAHTGAGGGNFGIVTRYWMRSPAAKGNDPTRLLPRPPAEVLDFELIWLWDSLDHDSFTRLVTQYGQWHRDNSAPGAPGAAVHSGLLLFGTAVGAVVLNGQVVGDDAEQRLADYLAAVTDGVADPVQTRQERKPWLHNVLSVPNSEEILGTRFKVKSGYLRERFSDDQIEVLWNALTAAGPQGAVLMTSFGGQVNAVDAAATAVAQRDSMLKVIFLASWAEPAADEGYLRWTRDLYAEIYSATGGVPAPDERNGGAFINYPDADLVDNTSGVPWHELYYRNNYRRLQQVKAKWDPRDVFRHALSVDPHR